MSDVDHIIVGSGINALVCAATLGAKGARVLVLERNDRIGGCMRTEEITAPGFIHDVMATTFVLFITSPAYAALGKDLARHGLEFCHAATPTGVLRPDGSHIVVKTDRAANVAALNALSAGDGDRHAGDVGDIERNAGLLFGLLGGALWSYPTTKLLAGEAWRRGPRNLAAFMGEALVPARGWLETGYKSDTVQALWAPWVLHAGLGPEDAFSGQIARVIAFALEAAGAPIVKGGAKNLLAAFEALIRERGGDIRVNADVDAIVQAGGRATGVRLASGETISATKSVICSVTPTQLYGRLLGDAAPKRDVEATRVYRYGKGNFQIQAAGLARRRAGRCRAAASDARARRRIQGLQRGVARPLAGGADHLCGPAARARPVALPRGQGHPVAATARGATPHQGRCRRQAPGACRRAMDRRVARGLCRPGGSDPRQSHRRLPRQRDRAPRLFAGRP